MALYGICTPQRQHTASATDSEDAQTSEEVQQNHGLTGTNEACALQEYRSTDAKIERWSTFILEQIWSLYGHVARGDVATASMLSWRGMKWWRAQQAIPVSWGGERHAHRFNPMMDTERHIVEVAGLDWQTKAQDRATWICLGDQFVAKYDVPWSSGEQLGLDNLDTNRRRPTKDRGNDRALALHSATRSHR